ncbi:2-C-methyl-D-erythritol 4-phosphate cytidylyltransferase [Parapedobacter sp.]
MDKPKHYAIILAGGMGNRFEESLPKQFSEVAGKPVLMHTLSVFHHCPLDIAIILSLHRDYVEIWHELVERHDFDVPHTVVLGGKERFHSAKNALAVIPEDCDVLVAVHDGVRPFVSQDVVINAYAKAREHGAVVPAVSTVNPIRLYNDGRSVALDRTYSRSDIHIVQTPQVFKYEILKKAFDQEYQETFRDDSVAVEHMGVEIHVVNGNRENIKITYPLDLALAEVLYPMMFEKQQQYTSQ